MKARNASTAFSAAFYITNGGKAMKRMNLQIFEAAKDTGVTQRYQGADYIQRHNPVRIPGTADGPDQTQHNARRQKTHGGG